MAQHAPHKKSHASRAPGAAGPANPPNPTALVQLAALFNQGRLAEAAKRARELAAMHPREVFCRKTLCCALLAMGEANDLGEAARVGAEAAELAPNDPQVHLALGLALAALSRSAEAEAGLRRALELRPDFPEALANLGGLLLARDRASEAEPLLRRAAELVAGDARMFANHAAALNALSRFAEAEAACRRAQELDAALPAAHNNLGMALNGQRRFAEAEECFRRAIELKPDYPEAFNNLGNALHELGRPQEAEERLRQGLAARPDDAKALVNLANVLHTLGHLPEAVALYRKAIALAPAALDPRSNLLFTLSHDPACPPEDYLAEARRFGRAATLAAGPEFRSWTCGDAAPLRVGLVSGDLHEHPVGHFLEAWLPCVDAAELALVAYPTTPDNDGLTSRVKPFFSDWRPLHGLSDAEAAERIRNDGVNVLLDLSGHTASNRLGVFALRPAPVQATWLGYFASTGVEQMDFFLADAAGVPPEDDCRYTERILRLPDTRLCFAPPRAAPEVSGPPAASTGRVTFGCFQNLTKLNEPTLDLWARALAVTPGSRLRLRNRQFGDRAAASALAQRLAACGVPPERLALLPALDRAAYLADYAHVDILLDTFPYPGGTTTCEALWMGVPTLTLSGGSLLARQGACLLRLVGLSDWIADTADTYAAKAAAFAADVPGLAALRSSLRARAAASPLFDGPRFARAFAEAVRDMWGRRADKDFQPTS